MPSHRHRGHEIQSFGKGIHAHPNYFGIILFRGGQFSWIVTFLLLRGGVISWMRRLLFHNSF